MPGTDARIVVLVVVMLGSGMLTSLASKYQDMQCVEFCDDPDPSKHREYSQPVQQSVVMFLGESLCMLAFVLKSFHNSWRSRDDPGAAKPVATSNISRAKRRATTSSHPDDSGVMVDDEQYLAKGRGGRPTTASLACSGPENLPFESHDAALTPLVTIMDDAEPVKDDIKPLHGANTLLLALPTMCDCIGTSIMNCGLLLVSVSVYQMTRGSLPIWVALFSRVFLKRHIALSKWLSLLIITGGVALVGWAGTHSQAKDGVVETTASDEPALAILGVFLIFFAQCFSAAQFCLEEAIMSRYGVEPMRAVGLEGVFGLGISITVMLILHFTIGVTPAGRGGYFDAQAGWEQLTTIKAVGWSAVVCAFSIALLNLVGLDLTRRVSAVARSIVDTCRSLGIWAVSLAIGWETFRFLQLVGFTLLVLGSLLFNNVVPWPNSVLRFLGEENKEGGLEPYEEDVAFLPASAIDGVDSIPSGSGWQSQGQKLDNTETTPLLQSD